MNEIGFSSLKSRLYKKIRCPECFSETDLKYKIASYIICNKCKTKFKVIGGIPILFSNESKKILNLELTSHTGKQMSHEYTSRKTFIKSLKQLFRIANLTYDFFDRKKLHKILTHNENCKYLILNVGGGPTREDSNILNLNIDLFPNVEIIADAHNLPFKTASVDGIMIAAVLEHVHNPNKVIEEIYRVLKRGGYVYSETPFLQHFHGYPNHYQNFTLIGHNYLFKKFKKIESGPITGPFTAVLTLILNLFEDLTDNKYIRKITMFIVALILYPFKYLDALTKKNKNVYKLTNGVYFLGQKT